MKDLEKKVLKHLRERKWDNLLPSDVAKSIMIEGAELLELFQWENRPLAEVRRDKEKLAEVKKELADVLIYCLEMSVLLGLDTEKLVQSKLAAVARKYPAKLMREQQEKPETEKVYWKIKKEYRMKG